MVIYNPTHIHLHYELQNTSCYWRDMGMLQVQKNHTFQDSAKCTLPLLASSMFMADLSMGIISHPYILREDIGQMTENTLKQHRIGNLKIFTGKEAYRTEIEVIASCGQVWCSLFETRDLFGVFFPFWSTMSCHPCEDIFKTKVLSVTRAVPTAWSSTADGDRKLT